MDTHYYVDFQVVVGAEVIHKKHQKQHAHIFSAIFYWQAHQWS
jgi:hypothetical protein